MSTVEDDIKRLNSSVSSLESDMSVVANLVERLDVTIERLTDVSTKVSQLLAVQGSRLEVQEKQAEKFYDLLEKRRTETMEDLKELSSKIVNVESDISKEMEDNHKTIIDKIDNIKTSIDTRMSRLERWVWIVLGGSGVVGFLINKIDISALF